MRLEQVPFITSEIQESPQFSKTFQLEQKPVSANLQITGLGLYVPFINGTKALDSYLNPGFNDYDGYLRVQEMEVSDLLNEGENRIDVLLGNGWYKGRFGLMSSSCTWGDEYLLCASLEIVFADGSTQVIETDDSWFASESCILSNSIYDGEIRDDHHAPGVKFENASDSSKKEMVDEINTAGAITKIMDFNTVGQYKAIKYCRISDSQFRLVQSDCPPIRAKLERKPVWVETANGEQVLDFGQNMAGIIRIHSHLAKGEQIHLTFGEILIDGNFCNTNYRSANGGYTYISDGVEKDVEPYFTYFGFRYVKVEVTAAPGSDSATSMSADDFTALVLYTDLTETMHVETSDPRLNRLLENSLWGQRSNFLDVPTDCPQRDERLGWSGDAQVFANTACFHMNCEEFYRKYCEDLRYDQVMYLHGDVAMFSPCQKDGAPGGPAWADAATIIPWTMYEHYANAEYLAQAYPMMRDYVEVLIQKDIADGADHILKSGHCFGDWLALDGASANAFKGGTDDAYIRSVYYWYSVTLAGKAAQVIGNKDDHQKYSALAQEIRTAIIREFFSASGRLCIDTQTGYVLAIYFDIYPDRAKIIEGFKTRLSKDKLRLKTGFVGTGFLLQALFKAGMDDYAYRMLFTDSFPGWFYAVNLGATTIWERWNSVMPDGSLSPTGMNSLNHYSYGAVASAVYTCIAGLKSDAPGWKRAVIAPRPNYRLNRITVAFDSPEGTWESGWEILPDGRLKVRAVVPHGATARIILPYYPVNDPSNVAAVQLSGEGFFVEAGCYEYEYEPTIDLKHPFDGDTFIADIVEHPQVVEAIKEALPGVCDSALDNVENEAASNLAGAIFFSPYPDLPERLDKILRSVSL